MSEVEQFWNAIAKKWPNPVCTFEHLAPIEQMMIVQAINIVLQVIERHEGR